MRETGERGEVVQLAIAHRLLSHTPNFLSHFMIKLQEFKRTFFFLHEQRDFVELLRFHLSVEDF